MPENIIRLPFGRELHHEIDVENVAAALAVVRKNVIQTPGGSISAHVVKPILGKLPPLRMGDQKLIIPPGAPYLSVDFTPYGRETPPDDKGRLKDITGRVQALTVGVDDYSHFLRVLSNPDNFRRVRLIMAFTNSIMANFAVDNLGFYFQDEFDEINARQKSNAEVNIFAIRKHLVAKGSQVNSLAKRIAKRKSRLIKILSKEELTQK